MTSISKLHEKCQKCKHKDNCNNKRMVACGIIQMPKDNTMVATTKNCTSTTININISTEEINDEITKEINKALRINCAFNIL